VNSVVHCVLHSFSALLCRYQSLAAGQPFSLITKMTFIHEPPKHHSRWRGQDYITKYDRFFFQWWNFLVYDAETHDHWTFIYMASKYSSKANATDAATAGMMHKRRSETIDSAFDAVPLADLLASEDGTDMQWQKKKDGTSPYRMTLIDDDTYNVVATFPANKSPEGIAVSWNVTFHRVHGTYTGTDTEETNKDTCAIVTTIFGYHSRVSGWIQEGDRRVEFGTGAVGAPGANRYRAYAAGTWGCALNQGYEPQNYPWTWEWIAIPADPTATPPRPEVGIVMATARWQLNVTGLGDLYGGVMSFGVGDEQVSSYFANLREGGPLQLPMSKASSDGHLRKFELSTDEWVQGNDGVRTFTLPLVQRYDVETSNYKLSSTSPSRECWSALRCLPV
jgi:hypothetical protein